MVTVKPSSGSAGLFSPFYMNFYKIYATFIWKTSVFTSRYREISACMIFIRFSTDSDARISSLSLYDKFIIEAVR